MTPTLPRNAEEYLSWLDVERGRSPRTLASYRRDLASYQAFVAQRSSGAVIDGATPAVVAAYVASLRRTRSGATVARSLSTLRGFHRFLVEEGQAIVDPTADIPGVAVADLLPKALSEDETDRLLGAVVGTGPAMLRDRALLELLYGTGARVSEVVGLMQVMPATASKIAEERSLSAVSTARLREPEVNIDFGAYYLAALRREFGARAGWAAMMILGGSVSWLGYSFIGVTDLPMAATFSAASAACSSARTRRAASSMRSRA